MTFNDNVAWTRRRRRRAGRRAAVARRSRQLPGRHPGGRGIGGLILLILVSASRRRLDGSGTRPRDRPSTGQSSPGPVAVGAGGSQSGGGFSQCKTGADANKNDDCLVIATVNSVQDYWGSALPQYGRQYTKANTVLYSGQTQSACVPPRTSRVMSALRWPGHPGPVRRRRHPARPEAPDAAVCWCLSLPGRPADQPRARRARSTAARTSGAHPRHRTSRRACSPTDGGDVVGWCGVAPRCDLSVRASAKIPHVDDLPVWSVRLVPPGPRRATAAGDGAHARCDGAVGVRARPRRAGWSRVPRGQLVTPRSTRRWRYVGTSSAVRGRPASPRRLDDRRRSGGYPTGADAAGPAVSPAALAGRPFAELVGPVIRHRVVPVDR